MKRLVLTLCKSTFCIVFAIGLFNSSNVTIANAATLNTDKVSVSSINQEVIELKDVDKPQLILNDNLPESNLAIAKVQQEDVPVSSQEGQVEVQTASTSEHQDVLQGWISGNYFTGDWHGLRSELEDRGISIQGTYVNDSFASLAGGVERNRRVKPLGLFDIYANFDTEKLGLWKGGTFTTHIQSNYGKGIIGSYIGGFQNISNIDAGDSVFQISEYFYNQSLFDDKVNIKIGKQDANADFVSIATGANFLNASYGCMPNIPLPTYPNPGLGVALTLKPLDHLTIKSGIYDGGARGSTTGFDTAFHGDGSKFIINQVGVDYNIKEHPGDFLVGSWISTKSTDELSSSDDARTFSNNHGFYLSAEQLVYKENKKDPNDDQGLAIFGQFSAAPADRNEIPTYYSAGMQYKGLIPKRDNDFIGIGLSNVNFSNRLQSIEDDGRHGSEKALELFYKAQVNPWFVVQPDVQIISRPDGQSTTSVAVGLRTVITL